MPTARRWSRPATVRDRRDRPAGRGSRPRAAPWRPGPARWCRRPRSAAARPRGRQAPRPGRCRRRPPRVARGEGHRPDGRRGLVVGPGRPGPAAVGALPDPAPAGQQVPGVARVDRHRHHPPRHPGPAPRPGPGRAAVGDRERAQRPPGRAGEPAASSPEAAARAEGGEAGGGVAGPSSGWRSRCSRNWSRRARSPAPARPRGSGVPHGEAPANRLGPTGRCMVATSGRRARCRPAERRKSILNCVDGTKGAGGWRDR